MDLQAQEIQTSGSAGVVEGETQVWQVGVGRDGVFLWI